MIIIDSRESRTIIPQQILNFQIPFRVEPLEIGDYLIGDVCIERKDTNDYVQSLLSGHLHQQLYNMSTNYVISYLVVEGSISLALIQSQINRNVYISSLAGTTIKRSPDGKCGIINLISLENEYDTALFLKFLHEKIENNEPRLPKIVKTGITENDRLMFILCSFPNIGLVKAQNLLEHFKTIEQISTATPEQLTEIIGQKRGQELFLWLHKIYNKQQTT